MKRTRDEKEYGVTLESKRSSRIHCDYRVLEVGEEQQEIWLQREAEHESSGTLYAMLRSQT